MYPLNSALYRNRPIQKLAKIRIYLILYVCTERIFDSRPFIYNTTALHARGQKLVKVSRNIYLRFIMVHMLHVIQVPLIYFRFLCAISVKTSFLPAIIQAMKATSTISTSPREIGMAFSYRNFCD